MNGEILFKDPGCECEEGKKTVADASAAALRIQLLYLFQPHPTLRAPQLHLNIHDGIYSKA